MVASHFSFGTDYKVQHVPEYNQAYVEKKFDPNPFDSALANDIRSSHISYMFSQKHQGNVAALGRTTYQERISEMAKSKRQQPKGIHVNLHATNFVLGDAPTTMQSEAASRYM